MSELFKPLYYDTDSVVDNKTLTAILARRNGKAMLNAMYGAYCEADVNALKEAYEKLNKEKKNMNREYIVLHNNGKTGIVFKDSIDSVVQGDHETIISINGHVEFCDDKYEDVVRQLLK